jgi:hypothetical protein
MAAISIANVPGSGSVPLPTIGLPPSNPFAVDQTGEWKAAYDSTKPGYKTDLSTGWDNFITTFFPDIAGCIRDNSDNWICDIILNGGAGIPPAVEQQIWDRARSRELELANQNVDNATNEWAARGFALPPGALINRVQQAQQDYIDKAATVSRDTAIKNIEIQVENVRFAIGEAVKLRLGAVAAAVDYIKAYFLPVQTAQEYATRLTDAHYRYYNAMQSYYAAIIGAAQLTLEAQKTNVSARIEDNKAFVALTTSLTNSRVMAAAHACNALGTASAASMGSNNTLGNVGSNDLFQK